MEINTEHIFVKNKHRILQALNYIPENEAYRWFSQTLWTTISRAKADPEEIVEYHYFNTKELVGFLLPLVYAKKVALVVVLEKKRYGEDGAMTMDSSGSESGSIDSCDSCDSGDGGDGDCSDTSDTAESDDSSESDENEFVYNIVTVILPAWAYNNARILGEPETGWMTKLGIDLADEQQDLDDIFNVNEAEKKPKKTA